MYFYGEKGMQSILSSNFLKQQWSRGNSFSVSFCLPLPGDQFQSHVVERNLKSDSYWMSHWVGEGFMAMLLTKRALLRAQLFRAGC